MEPAVGRGGAAWKLRELQDGARLAQRDLAMEAEVRGAEL
eukprot:COSAG01_NODE_2981_length_6758_cov_11.354408_9_plen_39_part_01